MNKPEKIVYLEEYYSISLTILPSDLKIEDEKSKNTFKVDDSNEVIGLNLSDNEISDLTSLLTLSNLNELVIKKNLIIDIWPLFNLEKLTYLDLSHNTISDLSPISTLTLLKVLKLSHNSIESIEPISKLYSLYYLQLTNNNITDILCISKLAHLTNLHLMNNNIKDISALLKLNNLSFIDLDENKISDISPLSGLIELKYLYLNFNIISDLKPLLGLTKLETLSLSYNRIIALFPISKLNNLVSLHLAYNQISDISSLSTLTSLNSLEIGNNNLFDISPIIDLPNLTSVSLYGNKIIEQNIPQEVLAADWLAVKLHIKDKNQLIDFNEVKILLLGNPNIGKSDMLEYLEKGIKPTQKESTVGIQYKKIGWGKIHLNIWDFGGQEYFHATHKLFFSPNALNIVLWGNDLSRKDAMDNEIKETCFDLTYWLRSIEQLNKYDSAKDEVLVLENKIDLNENTSRFIDQLSLSNQFKNIKFTFHSISLMNMSRVGGLNEIIQDITNILTSKRSKTYGKYTKKIEETKLSYLSINDFGDGDEYEAVCSAMKVFHNSGMLLYFDKIIKDKVFIKPQALLDLLYQGVLSDERKDRLTKTEIEEKVKGNELGLTVDDVIGLLKHFDLVFQLENLNNEYFIPQYLKPAPALIDYFSNHEFSKLSIQIKADNFLMSQAMLKIFTTYGKYVKGNSDQYLFWKDGIVIEKEGILLMIKFQNQKQTIQLYNNIKGTNFNLQKEIVDFILNMPLEKEKENEVQRLSEMELPIEENGKKGKEVEIRSKNVGWDSKFFTVEISNNGVDYARWTDIYNSVQSNRILSNGKWFNSRDFKPYLKNQNSMKKIFISYSKDDLTIVNSYINSLQPLVLEGTIDEPWYCTYLSPGDEVHNKISSKMEEADIICFMCSNNFFKTSYIIDHELKPALKRKKDGGKQLILPIIIDRCKWISANPVIDLGVYAGFPYKGKPVSDFSNWNDAWYVSNWFLEQVIKSNNQSLNDYDFDAVVKLNGDIADLLERQINGGLSKGIK